MNNWCLEVWGDFACFTRPEMKVERVSYDVITPSAARAIFESILWKPAIKWNISKVEVLNPIKWISIRRNELGKVASVPTEKQMSGAIGAPMGIFIEDERHQRAGLFLKDVRYRIYGHFDFIKPENRVIKDAYSSLNNGNVAERLDESEGKYAAMFQRRASKGQCFHRPYLGCREFACDFKLVEENEREVDRPINETRDLGFMLYDMDFNQSVDNPTPLFFRAQMENGVVIMDRKQVEVIG